MFFSSKIWTIAIYEAKILLRAWSFRIFTILGLVFAFVYNLVFGTKLGDEPYILSSLTASLPFFNMKMLNVYQSVIAAFLASDFIKRDKKLDTTQVVYTRSMSNASYILGKVLGIMMVFAVLNLLVLGFCFFFHSIFSETAFSWQPYVGAIVFISIPTLLFMIGLSVMLINLVRSQAIVFVVLVGTGLASLTYFGAKFYQIADIFAFHFPIMYSDMVGYGNLQDILLLRGAYAACGIGLIAASILAMNRLSQSRLARLASGVVAVVGLLVAVSLAHGYYAEKIDERNYRAGLLEISERARDEKALTIEDYRLDLNHRGEQIVCSADISARNNTDSDLDSLLFTINPGLIIEKVTVDGTECRVERAEHVVWLYPAKSISPGTNSSVGFRYSGKIDERVCYLDVSEARLNSIYRFAVYSAPKRYAFVTAGYLLLTPESLFYPISGLPGGAAFPKGHNGFFANFDVTVGTSPGLSVICPGARQSENGKEAGSARFISDTPLSRFAVIAGNYETRSVEVDDIDYSLVIHPNHNFFDSKMDSVADTIPHLIRELKRDFEMAIGLEYPYRRLSLVEVPIQFYSYDRFFTYAHEADQPEITMIPEQGTIGDGTDFNWMKRRATRRQERANQARSAQDIQAEYFTTFARIDLLGVEHGRNMEELSDVETKYGLLPQYVSNTFYIDSREIPILNFAFEAYIYSVVKPPQDVRWRSWRGLTDTEKGNLLLREMSLGELLQSEEEQAILTSVMIEKGSYLLRLIESGTDPDLSQSVVGKFIADHRFKPISRDVLVREFSMFAGLDLEAYVDEWYSSTQMPGYEVGEIECYKITDNGRAKTQVNLTISNPEYADGVITIGARSAQTRDVSTAWWRRGLQKFDHQEYYVINARTKNEISFVLDDEPMEISIETYVSRNLPSVVSERFRNIELDPNKSALDTVIVTPLDTLPGDRREFVVDNEDSGFKVLSAERISRLRATLLKIIGKDEEEKREYVGLWYWDPPKSWQATTHTKFFGRYVHSGFYKNSGEGENRVSWIADLENPGLYDVYYHNEDIPEPGWMRRRGGSRDKGSRSFVVHHEDGEDVVKLDLNQAEEGWNLLGSYRFAGGASRVDMTDENAKRIVTADAIKWIRK